MAQSVRGASCSYHDDIASASSYINFRQQQLGGNFLNKDAHSFTNYFVILHVNYIICFDLILKIA